MQLAPESEGPKSSMLGRGQLSLNYHGMHGTTKSADTALPYRGTRDCQPQYQTVPRQHIETAGSMSLLPTEGTRLGAAADSSWSSFEKQQIPYDKMDRDRLRDNDVNYSSATGDDDRWSQFSFIAHENVPSCQQSQWLAHESTSSSSSAGGNSSKPHVRPLMSISAVPTRNFSGKIVLIWLCT